MRQLVTIRIVSEITPIEGADIIELAKIDGWQCVVKKGEFEVGDPGLYFEIDSQIPANDTRFNFLSSGQKRSHHRIKTVKLRGTLSQGLLMPTSILSEDEATKIESIGEGDLSEVFGVTKYEPTLPQRGQQKGNFPEEIPKTAQPRVQNLTRMFNSGQFADRSWNVTEKLDGTSCTIFSIVDDDLDVSGDVPPEMRCRVGVCSRNWEMDTNDANLYTRMFEKLGLKEKLIATESSYAIQGEIIGPGIQKNKYNLTETEFYVFDVYDIAAQKYLTSVKRELFCDVMGLKQVPKIQYDYDLTTCEDLLSFAEGKSELYNTTREGLVFRCIDREEDGTILSFKVISNKFLLKQK